MLKCPIWPTKHYILFNTLVLSDFSYFLSIMTSKILLTSILGHTQYIHKKAKVYEKRGWAMVVKLSICVEYLQSLLNKTRVFG